MYEIALIYVTARQGTMETMLAGCICGLIWHTTSGQPLCIVGATGPMLIFEGILYVVCRYDMGIFQRYVRHQRNY